MNRLTEMLLPRHDGLWYLGVRKATKAALRSPVVPRRIKIATRIRSLPHRSDTQTRKRMVLLRWQACGDRTGCPVIRASRDRHACVQARAVSSFRTQQAALSHPRSLRCRPEEGVAT